MVFELKQQFRIESARRLPLLPETHPCAKIHGHSFLITLIIRGELDKKIGWLIDYNEVKAKMEPIIKLIDHKYLNEVPGLENPTSEYLAHWIYEKARKSLPALVQVRVSETPDSECAFPIV